MLWSMCTSVKVISMLFSHLTCFRRLAFKNVNVRESECRYVSTFVALYFLVLAYLHVSSLLVWSLNVKIHSNVSFTKSTQSKIILYTLSVFPMKPPSDTVLSSVILTAAGSTHHCYKLPLFFLESHHPLHLVSFT